MLKQTPLNQAHRAAGARMVDFGGWDMPVNYGSQIDEHHAVRQDAGMFDVSHMRAVDLAGGGVRDFLRYALANNVDKLREPGKALYSCLLRPDGGVLDDLIVYFLREDLFRLVVNAGTTDKDIAWLTQLLAQRAPHVQLTPRDDLAMIAVQGPNARAKLWQALPGTEAATAGLRAFFGAEAATKQGAAFIARTGYTGEDGFEIMVSATRAEPTWNALRAAGVRPCGLGARDTLRLEAGMNLYGQDMDESVSPLASGLAWTVDLASPRDFVGKDALVRTRPHKDWRGSSCSTRAVFCARIKRSRRRVAKARSPAAPSAPRWASPSRWRVSRWRVDAGDVVRVAVRDKQLAARVVKPPFVRHGKVLVEE